MLQAGKLTQRVTLERPLRTTNGAGETVITAWKQVRSVWAEVLPLKSWQVERGRAVQSRTTHTVRIRHAAAPDVAPGWRVSWRNQPMPITGITNPDGRGEDLELACELQHATK